LQLKALILSTTIALCATHAVAQTSGGSGATGYSSGSSAASGSTSSGAQNDHFYSHYTPYFPLMGPGIPSQSTYKPYFPPAYSTQPAKPGSMQFGARVVETGSHIDLLHKNFTGATVDASTGVARFSHDAVPGTFQGNVWYGYYGGCRAEWFWDRSYHRYVRQRGCI